MPHLKLTAIAVAAALYAQTAVGQELPKQASPKQAEPRKLPSSAEAAKTKKKEASTKSSVKSSLPPPKDPSKSEQLKSVDQSRLVTEEAKPNVSSPTPQSETTKSGDSTEEVVSTNEEAKPNVSSPTPQSETTKSGDSTEEVVSTAEEREAPDKKELGPLEIGAIAAGVGLALGGAGGGGSGGGGRSYSYFDSASGAYLTEYDAQSGLSRINARNLNDYNYSGYGIRLAIVDSGIASSHQEFSGRSINGTDFASTSGGATTDLNGHGTHVASIAAGNRDAVGMRGVAYDATLYSYKIGNDAGSLVGVNTDAKWAAVVDRHVTDSIKISNNSWGTNAAITSYTEAQLRAAYPLSIAAYQNAVTNGTIFVWAAGNAGLFQVSVESGLPHRISGLADQWLAVVSVNSSNVETAYTNRCGVAAAWCVTAPGGGDNQAADGIYAAQSGGTYVRLSGTSMAAPHVSGLLAALAEKFPELSSAQLVSRLKTTSSLTGLTSTAGCTVSTCTDATMRAIFGHGLVNGQAAMARIGNYVYPKDDNVFSGNSIDLGKQLLAIPQNLTNSAREKLLSQTYTVFDSHDGATFRVPGKELFSQQRVPTKIMGYAPSVGVLDNQVASPKFGITASEQVSNGARITLSQSDRALGSSGVDFWGPKLSLLPTAGDQNGSLRNTIEYSIPLSSTVRLVPYFVTTKEAPASSHGLTVVWQPMSRTSILTSYGSAAQQESRTVLPGYGGTGFDRSTPLRVGIRHQVSETVEAFGHASRRVLSDSESTPRAWGYRGASYTSALLGLEYSSLYSKIAIGIYQPEQITSGVISLVVPSGRLPDGTVLWREQAFLLSEKPRYAGFVAARYSLDKKQKTELLFQAQQSTVDTDRLDKVTVSFITSF